MIYLCDFEDSFTYNLYSELSQLTDFRIEIIKKRNTLKFLKKLLESEEKAIVILGPGPGHPQDYDYLDKTIQELLFKKNFMVFGICLGHQLVWKNLGAKVDHCYKPTHGMSCTYQLNSRQAKAFSLPKSIEVQKYNSLCVEISSELVELMNSKNIVYLVDGQELVMAKGESLLTYQFHPESIGTTCPSSFFKQALNFLI